MLRFAPLLLLAACGGGLLSAKGDEPSGKGDDEPDVVSTDVDTDTDTDDGRVTPGRCTESGRTLSCTRKTLTFNDGIEDREVHHQVPLGDPPRRGWPVAILFQGSGGGDTFWSGFPAMPLGGYQQVRLVQALLDTGYAVVQPEAKLNATTFWDTNIPPDSTNWTASRDHALMVQIFAGIRDGRFGDLDPGALYATGLSSGGYMTSRMALSYPGRFRALAVHSASWATCAGALCTLPSSLPADHPPTLFLHGKRDFTVPISTMHPYADALDRDGVPIRKTLDDRAGHEWLSVAPSEIVGWFSTF